MIVFLLSTHRALNSIYNRTTCCAIISKLDENVVFLLISHIAGQLLGIAQ